MKASKATAIAPQRVNVPLWAGVGAIVIGGVLLSGLVKMGTYWYYDLLTFPILLLSLVL